MEPPLLRLKAEIQEIQMTKEEEDKILGTVSLVDLDPIVIDKSEICRTPQKLKVLLFWNHDSTPSSI
ncbi:hypothetical protein EST38_g14346 [Candolleomyces aberdarensis]|uniref:Uncharacterized protein n=1 Tax=Candolleomyces aberdarensis TaxID=2316362 RepID=A0A4Q2CYI6_9AGAR|nr:hypothetical protein EST38_g14346 [Candolleomyces aberdarensis]